MILSCLHGFFEKDSACSTRHKIIKLEKKWMAPWPSSTQRVCKQRPFPPPFPQCDSEMRLKMQLGKATRKCRLGNADSKMPTRKCRLGNAGSEIMMPTRNCDSKMRIENATRKCDSKMRLENATRRKCDSMKCDSEMRLGNNDADSEMRLENANRKCDSEMPTRKCDSKMRPKMRFGNATRKS
jgi:hypothetical protein